MGLAEGGIAGELHLNQGGRARFQNGALAAYQQGQNISGPYDVSQYEASGKYSPGDLDFLSRTQIPTEAPEWFLKEVEQQKQHWDPSWGPFEHESWEDMQEEAKVHMMRELGPYDEREYTNPNTVRMPPVLPIPPAQAATMRSTPTGITSVVPQKTVTQNPLVDPRMYRAYEVNKQLMGDPRMRQASGGRARFDNGGMSRRSFLKLMGGLASIPVLGKFFKFAKPAVKAMKAVEKSNAVGMPKWFPSLVNKVMNEGKDVTKQYSTVERSVVKQAELPNSKTKILVEQDLATGNTTVDVGLGKHGWTDGWNGQPVRLHLKKGEWIEPQVSKTGKVKKKAVKSKDEFDVEEAEFTGDAESVKYEDSSFNKFGEHGSDFSEVEKYATGKVTKGSKPTKHVWEADWDDSLPDDYAKGGLAGVLKL